MFFLLILLLSVNEAYCQDFYDISLPTGIEARVTEDREILEIYSSETGESLNIRVWAYGSVSVSDNRRYLAAAERTDVIGSIKIYDIKSQKLVVSETFGGTPPKWMGNSLKYEFIYLYGGGYSIREWHTFINGKLERSKQYLGGYHGARDSIVDPFCENYRLEMFPDLYGMIHLIGESVIRYSSTYPTTIRSISNTGLFVSNPLSKDVLIDFIDVIVELFKHLAEESPPSMELAEYWLVIYPFFDRCFEQKLFEQIEFNTVLRKLLVASRIDPSIVLWLFK